jgi:hypothetical protein
MARLRPMTMAKLDDAVDSMRRNWLTPRELQDVLLLVAEALQEENGQED